MAGTSPFFDPVAFRASIKATMQMGVPTDPALRVVWHWDRQQTFARPDPAGNPYDWTAAPATDVAGNPDEPGGAVTVDYAIEFAASPRTSEETPLGEMDAGQAIITLLDVDYEKIKDADFATIDTTRYDIEFTAPPVAMFEVTVFQLYMRARDEA